MIDTYEKFRIPDQKGEKDFFIEVNWEDNEATKDCRVLKVTFPNGDVTYVKKEYMNTMLFAIGKAEEQQKMIPQKIIRTKWYETVLSVKATKDIRKGESIVFPIKISLPSTEQEAIAEIKQEKRKALDTGLAIPS